MFNLQIHAICANHQRARPDAVRIPPMIHVKLSLANGVYTQRLRRRIPAVSNHGAAHRALCPMPMLSRLCS
jgi:hypothetical protein